MPKSYQYWETIWDGAYNNEKKECSEEQRAINFAMLTILGEYSQGIAPFLISDFIPFTKMLVSNFFSFIKGYWNRHHREAVVDTITYYYKPSIEDYRLLYTPEYMLARLKKHIEESGNPINCKGGDCTYATNSGSR